MKHQRRRDRGPVRGDSQELFGEGVSSSRLLPARSRIWSWRVSLKPVVPLTNARTIIAVASTAGPIIRYSTATVTGRGPNCTVLACSRSSDMPPGRPELDVGMVEKHIERYITADIVLMVDMVLFWRDSTGNGIWPMNIESSSTSVRPWPWTPAWESAWIWRRFKEGQQYLYLPDYQINEEFFTIGEMASHHGDFRADSSEPDACISPVVFFHDYHRLQKWSWDEIFARGIKCSIIGCSTGDRGSALESQFKDIISMDK